MKVKACTVLAFVLAALLASHLPRFQGDWEGIEPKWPKSKTTHCVICGGLSPKTRRQKRTPAQKAKGSLIKRAKLTLNHVLEVLDMQGRVEIRRIVQLHFGVGVAITNQLPPKAKAKTVTKSMNILGQNVVQCGIFYCFGQDGRFHWKLPVGGSDTHLFHPLSSPSLGDPTWARALFNSLIGTKVAVSSKTPGRTQV